MTAPTSSISEETLDGVIDRVIYQGGDDGFVVVSVEIKGRREAATVVGHLIGARTGEHVVAVGQWANDARRGLQFKASSMRLATPTSVEGIEAYLASGRIKGIGKTVASQLVERFGAKVFDIIEKEPQRLREIKGIGRKRVAKITESWKSGRAGHEVMVFLQSHGIGAARAATVFKRLGDTAIEKVRANPWCLADEIDGIGFTTADAVARSLGVDPHSTARALAGIRHVLDQLTLDGHCACGEVELSARAARILEIDEAEIRAATQTQIDRGVLVRERRGTATWIYLADLHRAEVGVAARLRKLLKGSHPLPKINLEKSLAWAQRKSKLTLAPNQREAVSQAAKRKVLVITGGPGVGKTTIVNCILKIYAKKDLKCVLCAPTGRAAKRLLETTDCSAQTIHRLLEFDPIARVFTRNEDIPLEGDLFVVDETSMVDIALGHALLSAIPDHAALLLVGDADQLPSVGPGRLLGDILESGAVPTVRLTEIFRQGPRSRIVQAAHAINGGDVPDLSPPAELSDFYFVAAESQEAVQERIVQIVTDRIPDRFGLDPMTQVQVLTPMNKHGLGTRNLNQLLQSHLNPASPAKAELQRMGSVWRTGDKVMQIVNNYDKDVFNGDVGFIRRISSKDQEVEAEFDGRALTYTSGELDQLTPAYAVTIHKSQGSEYPAVVVVVHHSHNIMLQRNLIYTAVTRGRSLVVLVGTQRALSIAAGRIEAVRRNTALAERLRN
ncbi:MAG: ATP-dependent RecD-like DNA helicase [Planctomycetota bacterium]|nr:ATP-dependent RecD-like DNA helicase [Planctomycetota bacterium]